jgi:type II secretory pathway pseudopilin PulG
MFLKAANNRAMSIIEILVTLPLVVMLFGLIFNLLVPSFQLVTESSIKAELQQLAQISTNQMVAELGQTPPSGVSLAIPPNSLSPMIMATNPILSADPSTGSPTFKPFLVLFYNDPLTKNLYRKDTPQPAPGGLTFSPLAPLQVNNVQLESLATSSYPNTKKLAHHVETFLIQKEPTTGGEVYRIELLLSQELSGTTRKGEALQIRKIFLRNH